MRKALRPKKHEKVADARFFEGGVASVKWLKGHWIIVIFNLKQSGVLSDESLNMPLSIKLRIMRITEKIKHLNQDQH